MDDIHEYIHNLTKLLHADLIIGDHDSISVFGSAEQQRLGELEKEITHIFLKQGCDIEITINHILDELGHFNIPRQGKKLLTYKSPPMPVLMNYYSSTIKYIDKLKLEMNLQEAGLLKEISLLERLRNEIEGCGNELQNCLDRGNALLSNRDRLDGNDSSNACDVSYWWERLQQRIDDINLSLTVSMQTLAQIDLLKENNARIVKKIIDLTTNVIPLWESQIKAFISIAQNSDKYILNQKLCDELKLLSNVENKDIGIRNELRDIIHERSD